MPANQPPVEAIQGEARAREVIQADHEKAASYYCSRAMGSSKADELRRLIEREEADDMDPLSLLFARHRLAFQSEARAVPSGGERDQFDGAGFVYWNPDSGEEYAPNHPIDSGECVEAERVRRSTGQEDTLHAAFQEQWKKAEALSLSLPADREAIAREDLCDMGIVKAVDIEPIAKAATDRIMTGFSFSTLLGPENLRARLSMAARDAAGQGAVAGYRLALSPTPSAGRDGGGDFPAEILTDAKEALGNMMMLRRFSTSQGQRDMVDHAIATLRRLTAALPPATEKAEK